MPRPSSRSHLRDAFFGERRGAVLFVDGVIDFLNQLGNDLVDAVVLVGGFLGGAGNDQRSARFVDQDGVHFVDDGELVAALDAIVQVVLHVVAQVVEAEFVVGAVGDVGGVGGAALHVVQIVDDHADGQAQHVVNGAHPFGVAAGQVVVDGDDVHAAAGERVQIGGQGGDERLAFAGLHFGDFAFVQDHAADQLHVEMAHAQRAAARFADQGERRDQGRLDRILQFLLVVGIGDLEAFHALEDLRPEFRRLRAQFLVGKFFHLRLERVDRLDEGLDALDVALVLRADEARNNAIYDSFNVHNFRLLSVLEFVRRPFWARSSRSSSQLVIRRAALRDYRVKNSDAPVSIVAGSVVLCKVVKAASGWRDGEQPGAEAHEQSRLHLWRLAEGWMRGYDDKMLSQ